MSLIFAATLLVGNMLGEKQFRPLGNRHYPASLGLNVQFSDSASSKKYPSLAKLGCVGNRADDGIFKTAVRISPVTNSLSELRKVNIEGDAVSQIRADVWDMAVVALSFEEHGFARNFGERDKGCFQISGKSQSIILKSEAVLGTVCVKAVHNGRDVEPRRILVLGDSPLIVSEASRSSSIALCNLKGGVGVMRGVDSYFCGSARQDEAVKQPRQPKGREYHLPPTPVGRVASGVSRFPLSLKVAGVVGLWLLAWRSIYRGIDRIEGWALGGRWRGLLDLAAAACLILVGGLLWL